MGRHTIVTSKGRAPILVYKEILAALERGEEIVVLHKKHMTCDYNVKAYILQIICWIEEHEEDGPYTPILGTTAKDKEGRDIPGVALFYLENEFSPYKGE